MEGGVRWRWEERIVMFKKVEERYDCYYTIKKTTSTHTHKKKKKKKIKEDEKDIKTDSFLRDSSKR